MIIYKFIRLFSRRKTRFFYNINKALNSLLLSLERRLEENAKLFPKQKWIRTRQRRQATIGCLLHEK